MRAPHLRPGLAVVVALAVVTGCTKSDSSSSTTGPAPAGALHTPHLQGGAFSAGMACADCHGPSGFKVDFSQNPAVLAGGATFDPATKTCSNVACHGHFDFNGVTGTSASMSWGDRTPLTCASCHGMPPTGHPPFPGTPDAKSCSPCHVDSVKADGTISIGAGSELIVIA